jgi:hypothetical protein
MRYAKGVGVRLTLRAIVLVSLVGLCGSSSAARHNVASPMSGAATAIAPAPERMIFGGEGHSTSLGCLNCTEYAADSLFQYIRRSR